MIEVRSPGQTTARSRLLETPRTPESVAAWMLRHLDALEVRQMSKVSLKARKSNLAHFNAWCVEHGLERPQDVTHAQVEAFQRHLYRYRRRDGQPLSASGQVNIITAINTFFSWLVKHRHLPSNPAADVELPRVPKGLRDPMTASEVEAVLAQPDVTYAQGLRDRASDIHIEPSSDRVRVRYRVDGALHDVVSLPESIGPAVVSRIKIMANLNIVERRRPQDGQISLQIEDRDVDIRVATTSVMGGEKVVLRLLDKSRPLYALSQLGMPSDIADQFRAVLRAPYGMVICAGPTGSG